ncbi:MAG: hypothetical protein LBJ18_02220 [Rickettsiales bacterium]|jgi:hypothetical protein|nr:hypothetical protein [Rickettsiales bacterium]
MKIKNIFGLALICSFIAGASLAADKTADADSDADDAEEIVVVEEIAVSKDSEKDAGSVSEAVAKIVAETAKSETAAASEPGVSARAAASGRGDVKPGLARVSMSRMRSSGTTGAPATAPEPIKSAAPETPAAAPEETIQCSVGEYPKNSVCLPCPQKNNPGVNWGKVGKDCSIKSCVSDKYELVGKGSANPKCVEKCRVLGGYASREWNSEYGQYNVCGTGEWLKCDDGFSITFEQTSGSDMKFGHCVPTGSYSGPCKQEGRTNVCEYNNTKALQYCENGFWGNCTVNKICQDGFVEGKRIEGVSILHQKEEKISFTECVEKEKESVLLNLLGLGKKEADDSEDEE